MSTLLRRFAPPALVGSVLFAAPAAAQAPPLKVTLVYETPAGAGCPNDSVFRAGVTHRLGYDPFRADASLHVAMRTFETSSGLSGLVEWHDDSFAVKGEQHFSPKRRDCAHLVDEMAFAVAVQIQLLGIATAVPEASARGDHEAGGPPAASSLSGLSGEFCPGLGATNVLPAEA